MSSYTRKIEEHNLMKRFPAKRVRRQVEFRPQPPHRAHIPDARYHVVEELIPEDEILIADGEDYVVFDGSGDFEAEQPTTASAGATSQTGTVDIFDLGNQLNCASPEEIGQIRAIAVCATRCKLEVDTSTFEYFSSSQDPFVRAMSDGLRGLCLLIQIEKERSVNNAKKALAFEASELNSILNPEMFAKLPPMHIQSIDGTEVLCLNDIFGQMHPYRGNMRTAVNKAANIWVSAILPAQERRLYTVSDMPKAGSKPLDVRFINPPAQILADALKVIGGEPENNRSTIAILFKLHIGSLLYGSRAKPQRKH